MAITAHNPLINSKYIFCMRKKDMLWTLIVYSTGLNFVAIQYPAIELKNKSFKSISISISSNLFWTTRSSVLWRHATFWGDTGLDSSFFSLLECRHVKNVQLDDSFLCLFSSPPIGESIKTSSMRFLRSPLLKYSSCYSQIFPGLHGSVCSYLCR